ncbi:AbrB/MazE/SpoVT family DNA-binding domain-containing protein [Armatimonas sp.]|uniref:AbrB/MazE/SpoVT family DNA-binding domain-containing protein n=1 Tax=Armatimonas sp. TaxID=1872638 RepID=UPI003753D1A9
MTTKVQKWGNSLAIRIPRTFAEAGRLTENAPVEMTISSGKLILERIPERPPLAALLERVTPENCHAEIDWGKPEGEEAW